MFRPTRVHEVVGRLSWSELVGGGNAFLIRLPLRSQSLPVICTHMGAGG